MRSSRSGASPGRGWRSSSPPSHWSDATAQARNRRRRPVGCRSRVTSCRGTRAAPRIGHRSPGGGEPGVVAARRRGTCGVRLGAGARHRHGDVNGVPVGPFDLQLPRWTLGRRARGAPRRRPQRRSQPTSRRSSISHARTGGGGSTSTTSRCRHRVATGTARSSRNWPSPCTRCRPGCRSRCTRRRRSPASGRVPRPRTGEPSERPRTRSGSWRTTISFAGSPPGPISPLSWVDQVLTLAAAHVPLDRIALGVATYGYDWSGAAPAAAMQWADVDALAAARGGTPQWDDGTASPWLRYIDDSGVEHTVWYEDARSLAPKLDLARRHGVSRIVLWRLGGKIRQSGRSCAPRDDART